ncbi:MAG: hypothetical protein HS115_06160 [Spirochaetales bacterium]|nr:hypothetical protein [Spirochaetales bacterium]
MPGGYISFLSQESHDINFTIHKADGTDMRTQEWLAGEWHIESVAESEE